MTKSASYMTRALKARDPRFARILGRLGYERADTVADDGQREEKFAADGELARARADYQRAFGKKPFHRWDVALLREKIEMGVNA